MFIAYEPSGRIRSLISVAKDMSDFYPDCIWVDEDIDWNTHYILDGEPTERPASPVFRTDLTLYDVPNGSTLWINGLSYAVEGEVELEFPLPGTYSLRVECFPYLDYIDEVTV